jgi:hypothetical protein
MKKATFDQEVERLQEDNSFRNFITRNYAMKIAFSYVLYPLATLLCAATSAVHLWVNFSTTISIPAIAGIMTAVIVIFLEVAKYFSADSVMDAVRDGIFSKPRPHRNAFFVVLSLMVLSYSISVFLDWKGAPIAAEYFKAKTDPIKGQLVSTDSINAYYDSRVAAETQVIADAKRMTWKGRVVERGQKLINKAQDTKITIEEQRQAALAAADAENGLIRTDYEEKATNAGFWFQNLVGLGIAVQFLSMFFISVYNDGAKYDLEKLFGIDINGDGHIGAPSPPPASGGTSYAPGYGFSTAAGPHTNPSATGPKAQPGSYTPPPRMEVRGFHNANTPAAQADSSTATYCNTTATEERQIMEGFSNENLKRMWKDLKRWWDSYNSARYTKATRKKHQDNYAAQMAMIEDILKSRAVDVDQFLNKKNEEQ